MKKFYCLCVLMFLYIQISNAQCLQDNVTMNGFNSYEHGGTSYDLCSDLDHAGISIGLSSTSIGTPTLTVTANVEINAVTVVLGKVHLVVASGNTLTINGNLNLEDGGFGYDGGITVESGANLVVTGDLSTSNFFTDGLDYKDNTGGDVFISGDGGITVEGALNTGTIDPTEVSDNIDWTVDCGNTDGNLSCDNGTIPVDNITDLPVELTYFEATVLEQSVLLEWETATEINASHFDIQRSTDRKNWEVIGTVQANGNTQVAVEYSFEDESPLPSAYYRLYQEDFDGVNETFQPILVHLEGVEEKLTALVMPNYISSGEQVQFSISGLKLGGDISIQVYNNQGHVVYIDQMEDITSKALLKPMDISKSLGVGIYYVVVQSGKETVKEKLFYFNFLRLNEKQQKKNEVKQNIQRM